MDEGYEIYCGLDVGKSEHHAAALNAAGERVFDKPLPQDEARLRELFTGLQQHGRVLVIVDQPNTIGALPIAVARDCGCTVAYLPGLAMRKAADLYPGKSKTDARDAYIIAETARAMPHTLRSVDRGSEVLAALKVLSGFDADLTHECTRAINRLRSLLLQIFPALERVFPGTVLTRSLVLELFIKYPGPMGLRAAGRSNVLRWARNHSRKDPVNLVDAIFVALGEQTVTVIGTEAVELVIPRVAAQIKELKHQRTIVAEEVEKLLDDFPLSRVLISMPGVGVKSISVVYRPTSGVFARCEGGHRVILGNDSPMSFLKENSAMTAPYSIDPTRFLSEQLEQASPDLLRQMLQSFITALMGAEADAVCGAEYGIASTERVNSRNGYRHRDFDTRAGTLDVAIPKLRQGTYFPDWLLERRRRAEAALTSVVATCYLLGVSTRRMEKLVESLGITRLSKSQVSNMARDLDEQVEAFRTRPLDTGPYTFVAADALVLKVREGGRVANVHALVATGVNADGHREVLGIQATSSEDGAGWLGFFRDLTARGLTGVKLVTSDAHAGLVAAIGATLPGASWQRCRTHYADVRIMPMSPVVPLFRAGCVELMSA